MQPRIATIKRVTKETDIKITLNLDGEGKAECTTGIAFFDHMLTGFAKHGFFDLSLVCKGDIEVDSHHTIEDVGIALGEAIKQAAGDKAGIRRYGHFTLPMDETLMMCAVDLCSRPYYVSDVRYTVPTIGSMSTEMIGDFFYAVSYSSGMNLHLKQFYGTNNHHIAEACFKAFAKALDMATSYELRTTGVLSTKGVL